MKNNKKTTIYTDGSSRGNPGRGGWGTIVINKGLSSDVSGNRKEVVELGGREEHTTNNRMEITAAIKALESIENGDREIIIYSDSKYLIMGITAWIHNWRRNGWRTADKKPVENKDLWEKLYAVANGKNIKWKHVDGHKGNVGNERCDVIATGFADGMPPKLFAGYFKDYDISATIML